MENRLKFDVSTAQFCMQLMEFKGIYQTKTTVLKSQELCK